MNALWASVGVSFIGVLISGIVSAFVSGVRWGQVRADLDSLRTGQADRVTKAELQTVALQLAEIRGMFRLTLKEVQPPT